VLYLDNHTQDPDETLMKPKILCFKIVGKLFKALKQLIDRYVYFSFNLYLIYYFYFHQSGIIILALCKILCSDWFYDNLQSTNKNTMFQNNCF